MKKLKNQKKDRLKPKTFVIEPIFCCHIFVFLLVIFNYNFHLYLTYFLKFK